MKQVTINLYSFSELGKNEQQKAILEHSVFLNEIDAEGRDFDEQETIEAIEANEYLFFANGEMANCTTYTGKHPKSGITDLKLEGSTYTIS